MFGLGFYAWLMIGGAVVALIAGLWLAARHAGKADERARQLTETLRSKERQDEAAAAAPRDRDALTRRLRDGKF